MRFTRRRWDAWSLMLATAVAVVAWIDGRWTALMGAGLFGLVRFRIPAEGFPATPLRALPPEHRRRIAWCAGSLPLVPAACVLALRKPGAWWIYPLAGALHVAITLRLARRADLARRAPGFRIPDSVFSRPS